MGKADVYTIIIQNYFKNAWLNSQYMHVYRTSVQGSTGFTPFFLMHVREAKLPLHVKVEQVTGEHAPELPSTQRN